jgi:acetoin utilization deacetylase AcuC-like enzyme
LARVHPPAYLERLREACARAEGWFMTPDCPISAGTWDAILLAAGAGMTAAAELLDGARCLRAFCAVRPPGHHAHADRAGGYCYVNNAVVAARSLLDADPAARVLIVDLDFHHGDGSESLAATEPRLAYLSLHADPARHFPGTGRARDDGRIVDLPQPRSGDAAWLDALDAGLERVSAFAPKAIVISLGTDALLGDPVGDLGISQDALAEAARRVIAHWPERPLISLLEGGYAHDALAAAVERHLLVLSGA